MEQATVTGAAVTSESIRFPLGLPGFENEREFELKADPTYRPLKVLVSAKNPDLCFLLLPVEEIEPAYNLAVSPEDLAAAGLGREEATSVSVLAVVAVAGGRLTANLLAPIVVNHAAGLAVQAVRWDTLYSHEHPVARSGRQEEVYQCS
jgi:flagellar assembly factor FliW